MKRTLLSLSFMGFAISAMETNFSSDSDRIFPDKKYCFICQNNAPRLGAIEMPISVALMDGQRFDYKAHAVCHKQVVQPLLAEIESNYPVGKVAPKYLHSFLWALHVQAYCSGKFMQKMYTDPKVLVKAFKDYLEENNL